MENSSFWSDRVKQFGHTGWADIAIYAFDQPNRIEIIHELISRYALFPFKSLLDFGCGTGEFTVNELSRFQNCIMYDTCEKVLEEIKCNSKKIYKISKFEELENYNCSYDVIISVTVLQHILEDEELNSILTMMSSKLRKDGIVILMESFYHTENSYIRNWNYTDFYEYFVRHGFYLEKGYDFYPETIYENADFISYSKHIDVRVMRKIYKYSSVRGKVWIRKILEHKAYHYKGGKGGTKYLSDLTANDGYKFLIFKKK